MQLLRDIPDVNGRAGESQVLLVRVSAMGHR